jgi:hypothetical protein
MSGARTGSRFLYEPFDSAHARIETHEKVFQERWAGLERRLGAIETALDRLERRLWVAVWGVSALMIGNLIYDLWEVARP